MKALPIPRAAFDQNTVALGKTGSGKSSAGRVIVEGLLDEQQPVCIIDPKGDWWGIKLSADGKKSGYPIVIFGGKHADIPINETAGAQIAELFATGNRSCVIDMRGWMPAQRTKFFIDFASTLFQKNVGRRWLLIDEVHNFAPKGRTFDIESGKCLHWANRLASEGRGLGVNLFGLSQRPQKVHNDFLTSCETLIALRVLHASDREAYRDWIDGCGDPSKGKEMITNIANLKRGIAYVWSPEIGFGPELVHFPMFKTYDSFKPQDAATAAKLTGWAEVNLDDIKQKLATVIKQSEENDPKPMRATIAKLTRELAAAIQRAEVAEKRAANGPTKIKTIEKPVVGVKAIEGIRAAETAMRKHTKDIIDCAKMIEKFGQNFLPTMDKLNAELAKVSAPQTTAFVHSVQMKPPTAAAMRDMAATAVRHIAGNGAAPEISAAARKVLTVLAQHPDGCNAGKLALLTGYRYSGGFRNTLSELRSLGLMEGANTDVMKITDAGFSCGPFDPMPTGEQLRQYWLNHPSFGIGERKILQQLLEYPESGLNKDQLCHLTGYQWSGGFRNYLGTLRTAGVIVGSNTGYMRVSEELLGGK